MPRWLSRSKIALKHVWKGKYIIIHIYIYICIYLVIAEAVTLMYDPGVVFGGKKGGGFLFIYLIYSFFSCFVIFLFFFIYFLFFLEVLFMFFWLIYVCDFLVLIYISQKKIYDDFSGYWKHDLFINPLYIKYIYQKNYIFGLYIYIYIYRNSTLKASKWGHQFTIYIYIYIEKIYGNNMIVNKKYII